MNAKISWLMLIALTACLFAFSCNNDDDSSDDDDDNDDATDDDNQEDDDAIDDDNDIDDDAIDDDTGPGWPDEYQPVAGWVATYDDTARGSTRLWGSLYQILPEGAEEVITPDQSAFGPSGSMPSANAAWATNYAEESILYAFNGNEWAQATQSPCTIISMPTEAQKIVLFPSGVGYYLCSDGELTKWDGIDWSVPIDPFDDGDIGVGGIDCLSENYCRIWGPSGVVFYDGNTFTEESTDRIEDVLNQNENLTYRFSVFYEEIDDAPQALFFLEKNEGAGWVADDRAPQSWWMFHVQLQRIDNRHTWFQYASYNGGNGNIVLVDDGTVIDPGWPYVGAVFGKGGGGLASDGQMIYRVNGLYLEPILTVPDSETISLLLAADAD